MTILQDYLNLDPGQGAVVAVCSSHPLVLGAAMAMVRGATGPLLIEATANQVNQEGGYTGMTPAGYEDHIVRLAQGAGIDRSRIVLGADHLGPHVWRHQSARAAMQKATVLARKCVEAGFRKLHLDTTAPCADDSPAGLSPRETAERAAVLCAASEAAVRRQPDRPQPVYVIGHEVPVPGGGLRQGSSEAVVITAARDLMATLRIYRQTFQKAGLEGVWERVAAVVVQPGVDFGDLAVHGYQHEKAAALSACHAQLPKGMVFEVHAADYQTGAALNQMAADHFRLLKVGPCLTFALRETVYALEHIEQAWPAGPLSHLKDTLEKVMLENPKYWQSRQTGSAQELHFLRHFSLRDRIRYYWSHPDVGRSLDRLLQNLDRPIPKSLLSQYLPDLMPEITSGALAAKPHGIIHRRIAKVLAPYFQLAFKNLSL